MLPDLLKIIIKVRPVLTPKSYHTGMKMMTGNLPSMSRHMTQSGLGTRSLGSLVASNTTQQLMSRPIKNTVTLTTYPAVMRGMHSSSKSNQDTTMINQKYSWIDEVSKYCL